jgi:hypothetical protein
VSTSKKHKSPQHPWLRRETLNTPTNTDMPIAPVSVGLRLLDQWMAASPVRRLKGDGA